ncbi:unnamed protein product, partial [marine sediment metagenome]
NSDFIGNELESGSERSEIVMQTLNDHPVVYADVSTSTAYDSTIIEANRNPDVINEYYLQNTTSWQSFPVTRDRLTDTNDTGYGVRRLYCDIAVPNVDYVMAHIQVKDKAGNISNIQPVTMKIPLNAVTEDVQIMSAATVSIDDGNLPVKYEEETDAALTSYQFARGVPRSDMDSTRSMIVKDVL